MQGSESAPTAQRPCGGGQLGCRARLPGRVVGAGRPGPERDRPAGSGGRGATVRAVGISAQRMPAQLAGRRDGDHLAGSYPGSQHRLDQPGVPWADHGRVTRWSRAAGPLEDVGATGAAGCAGRPPLGPDHRFALPDPDGEQPTTGAADRAHGGLGTVGVEADHGQQRGRCDQLGPGRPRPIRRAGRIQEQPLVPGSLVGDRPAVADQRNGQRSHVSPACTGSAPITRSAGCQLCCQLPPSPAI